MKDLVLMVVGVIAASCICGLVFVRFIAVQSPYPRVDAARATIAAATFAVDANATEAALATLEAQAAAAATAAGGE